MSTLSVPLTPRLEKFIEEFIEEGGAETKAEVARLALLKLERDNAVARVLKAQKDALEGKVFKGDLRELIKKFK